jgi:hypothetical protein
MFLEEQFTLFRIALAHYVPAGTFGNLFCTRIHSCAQHFFIELKGEADYSAGALLLLTIQWDV